MPIDTIRDIKIFRFLKRFRETEMIMMDLLIKLTFSRYIRETVFGVNAIMLLGRIHFIECIWHNREKVISMPEVKSLR